MANPYLMPYVYRWRFVDTYYCMRKDGDIVKIGDSAVLEDQDGDITVKETEFRGSEGLWELLKRNRVNKDYVTSDDLRQYKKILLISNAHLEGYQPGGFIVSGGQNLR